MAGNFGGGFSFSGVGGSPSAPLVPAQAENGVEILAAKVGLGGNPLVRHTTIDKGAFFFTIENGAASPTTLVLSNFASTAGGSRPFYINSIDGGNPDPVKNSVLQIGYNINNGDVNEGEIFLQIEGDYRPGGADRFFEYHSPEVVFLDGSRVRLQSFTVDKVAKQSVLFFQNEDYQLLNMDASIVFAGFNGTTAQFSIQSTGNFELNVTDLPKQFTIQITALATIFNTANARTLFPGTAIEAQIFYSDVNAAFTAVRLQSDNLALASAGPGKLYVQGNGGTANYPAGISSNGGAANTTEYLALGINDGSVLGRVGGVQGVAVLCDTRGGIDPLRVLVTNAANVGVVAFSIEDNGKVKTARDTEVRHLLSSTATPGVGLGAGAGGAGAGATIQGTDIGGRITVTIGAAPPAGSQTLLTVTLSTAYGTALFPVISPGDGASAGTYFPQGIYAIAVSAGVWDLRISTSVLVAGNVIVLQYAVNGI